MAFPGIVVEEEEREAPYPLHTYSAGTFVFKSFILKSVTR